MLPDDAPPLAPMLGTPMTVRAWWTVRCDFMGCTCETPGEWRRDLAVVQARAIGWLPPSRRTSIGGSRVTTGWICTGHTGDDFVNPHAGCDSVPLPPGAVTVAVPLG